MKRKEMEDIRNKVARMREDMQKMDVDRRSTREAKEIALEVRRLEALLEASTNDQQIVHK